jgi:hypothetical protein
VEVTLCGVFGIASGCPRGVSPPTFVRWIRNSLAF